MDWYSWLCKSNLEPGLVYEYSLVLSSNELEEDDIAHFNHDFLRSMGIAVAKHRLEILKLARSRSESRPSYSWSTPPPPSPIAALLAAIGGTKRRIARCIRSLLARRGDTASAIIALPRPPYAAGRGARGPTKGADLLKRSRRIARVRQARRPLSISGPAWVRIAPPRAAVVRESEGGGKNEAGWESLFRDLKPT